MRALAIMAAAIILLHCGYECLMRNPDDSKSYKLKVIALKLTEIALWVSVIWTIASLIR